MCACDLRILDRRAGLFEGSFGSVGFRFDTSQVLADGLRVLANDLTVLAGWLRRYVARVRQDAVPVPLRRERMNRANPKYVLRNYLAQQAIDALERGDASIMERLMAVLQRPYDEQPEHEDLAARRPDWARNKAGCSALSCSS